VHHGAVAVSCHRARISALLPTHHTKLGQSTRSVTPATCKVAIVGTCSGGMLFYHVWPCRLECQYHLCSHNVWTVARSHSFVRGAGQ
jgi:hypothetical protein